MAKTQTLSEALATLRRPEVKHLMVHNWKESLPPDSLWKPGYPGKPACPDCHGVGYLRFDLSIHHPMFGRLIVCDCVPEPQKTQIKERIDRLYEKQVKR